MTVIVTYEVSKKTDDYRLDRRQTISGIFIISIS